MNKYLLLSLVATALVAAGLYHLPENKLSAFPHHFHHEHHLIERNLHHFGTHGRTTYLKYKTDLHTLIQRTKAAGDKLDNESVHLNTECTVGIKHDIENKIYDLTVAYHKIGQQNQQLAHEIKMPEDLNQKVYNSKNTAFFKAKVNALSGEILEFEVPHGNDDEDTIQYITEELIQAIIPDLRKKTIENPSEEQDNIGHFKAEHSFLHHDENHLKLSKKYHDAHYHKFHLEGLNAPSVSYNRDLIVSKKEGLLKSGSSTHSFKIQNESQQQQDSDIKVDSVMGGLHVKLVSVWNFLGEEKDAHTVFSMESFRKSLPFRKIRLSRHRLPQNRLARQHQESERQGRQFLGDAPALHTKSVDIADFTVLKQKVEIVVEVLTFNDHITLQGGVKVNGSEIATLLKINTPNCVDYDKSMNKSKHIELFDTVWHIGGTVSIPVKATTNLKYGLERKVGTNGDSCDMVLSPHFIGDIDGQGKAFYKDTISAGVYASGTYMNTDLTFTAKMQKSNFAFNLALTGKMMPVDFVFGGNYKFYSCDMSKLSTFDWTQICKVGDEVTKEFLHKKSEEREKTFWTKQIFGGI